MYIKDNRSNTVSRSQHASLHFNNIKSQTVSVRVNSIVMKNILIKSKKELHHKAHLEEVFIENFDVQSVSRRICRVHDCVVTVGWNHDIHLCAFDDRIRINT